MHCKDGGLKIGVSEESDLKKTALKYGIKHIGCTDAKIYNEKSGENRKTILAALVPYYTAEDEKPNLSKYCRSYDYHIVCKDIMTKICTDLDFKDFLVFCDTGYHIDRIAAYNAGLGFFGLNTMLINEEIGSYFFIVYAVLNEDLKKIAAPPLKMCIKSKKCENACPGGAIKNGKIDESRCISAITQKKGELSVEEENLIKKGKYIFGCDICQDVCPYNRNLKTTSVSSFLSDRINFLKKSDIENLSSREFKEKYGKYAFSWRGKNVLLRNIDIMKQ